MIKKLKRAIADAINRNGVTESKENLLVLKGFDLKDIEDTQVDLSLVLKNKVSHFMNFVASNRRFLSFEEFLALEPFAVEQFERIVIIENNVYSSFYPLGIFVLTNIVQSLTVHFDKDSEENDKEIGDLSKYLEIFTNFTRVQGIQYVVYPEPNTSINVTKVYVWPTGDSQIRKQVQPEGSQVSVIYSELDYTDLVTNLLQGSKEDVFVQFETDRVMEEHYTAKLGALTEIIRGISIYKVRIKFRSQVSAYHEDFITILKTYWGYEQFRSLKCYDLVRLEAGEKSVTPVSQEEIISVLVDQCIKCCNSETFKDVFVTAPTGAGKSIMFQIPAIFLAQKNELLTIVISPLIGLMNNQVASLS